MEPIFLSNIVAIRVVMESAGGRTITLTEFKDLSNEDRQHLGDLARDEIFGSMPNTTDDWE